jgi:DNA-binding NarL/FixJ family response regulator
VSDQIRVGIVDADEDIRFGRRMLIDSQDDCRVVFEEESASGALERAPDALLDVLIIDHRVRGLDGISLIEKLIPLYQAANNTVPAIILTGPYFSHELLLASVSAGATDLVTLDSDSGELLKSVRSAMSKDDELDFNSLSQLIKKAKETSFSFQDILVNLGGLDERESQVLQEFRNGQDDDSISRKLDLPKYRVKKAIDSILAKCSLATRAQLFLAINSMDGKNG